MSSGSPSSSQAHRTYARLLLFVVVAALPVTLRLLEVSPLSFWLVMEDGIYESLGALSCLAAGLLFLFAATRIARSRKPVTSPLAWVSAVFLGLMCVLMFGEETSWGQRIFEFSTPSSIAKINYQNELTIHNLVYFQPVAGFNSLILVGTTALGLMILVLPRLESRSQSIARIVRWLGIPMASPQLGWLFLAAPLAGILVARILWDRSEMAAQYGCETFELLLELTLLFLAIDVFLTVGGRFNRPIFLRLAFVLLPVAALLGYQFSRFTHQTEAFVLGEIDAGPYPTDATPEQLKRISRQLSNALLEDPTNATLYYQLAQIYMAQREYRRAVRHYEQALQYEPYHAAARKGLQAAQDLVAAEEAKAGDRR